MQDNLTVAELIAILSTLPQNLPVDITMNMEYQQPLSAEDIGIAEDEFRGNYVLIGDQW